jgi:hypothetical protein
MNENEIVVRLTKNEALVLFEFLARFNKDDRRELFEDQSEQKTLWIIEGQLERVLGAPFDPNYLNILKEARDRVRDEEF